MEPTALLVHKLLIQKEGPPAFTCEGDAMHSNPSFFVNAWEYNFPGDALVPTTSTDFQASGYRRYCSM